MPSAASVVPAPERRADSRPHTWPGLWDDAPQVSCTVTETDGTLPAGLVGSLYRNGPGKRSLSSSYFDGDGMIRKVSFAADGTVSYKSRYIETPKYALNIGAAQSRARTAGTQRAGGVLANVGRMPAHEANTHIYPIAGRLMALEEGGEPIVIDAETLDTRGSEYFGGALSRNLPFSAHPHLDPTTGELFNFGVGVNRKGAVLRAFKISATGRFEKLGSLQLPYMTFLHDFALSQNWMGFFVSPLKLDMLRMMLGLETFFDGLRWLQDRPGELHLMSRDGTQVRRFECDPQPPFHVIAAREEGDEFVMDTTRMTYWPDAAPSFPRFRSDAFEFFGLHRIWRIRVNLRTGKVREEEVAKLPGDFPRGDDRLPMWEQRYSYLACHPSYGDKGLLRALTKLDLKTGAWETFDFGPGKVGSEPVFVPKTNTSAEDDGWLLAFVYDSARRATDCVVVDSRRVSDGPVFIAHLPVSAGFSFHGSWLGAS